MSSGILKDCGTCEACAGLKCDNSHAAPLKILAFLQEGWRLNAPDMQFFSFIEELSEPLQKLVAKAWEVLALQTSPACAALPRVSMRRLRGGGGVA
eukprot:2034827-Amphidinium_carterae.1